MTPSDARTAAPVDLSDPSAVAAARAALLEQAPAAQVGDHLGAVVEDAHVVTHSFASTAPGYRGWHWSVTVARPEGQDEVTVDEVVLVPGDDAIVAPAWVPYKERVRSGDMSPGDLLPVEDDDPRLVPTWSYGDDPLDADDQAQVRVVAQDLGLGRVRTLSREGLDLAAQRWYDGDGGPASPLAQQAPATCWSCGFLVRLAGSLTEMFGVCANGGANDDGRVVSLDHGCGGHSETAVPKRQQPQPLPEPVLDESFPGELETF